jgi:prolyl-tRNA editing enzyme YbaK/EbsC (Cys-tRNA(Pro) deacylase)
MDESTHTAQQAADAIGCSVAAIVKSLLFLAGPEDAREPVLVLASGPNRVDPGLVEGILGVPVVMSDAKTVKLVTGYSIGGVPPLGHPEPLRTVFDETLLDLAEVWAAAGSANSVFPIAPARLVELTGATVARVS